MSKKLSSCDRRRASSGRAAAALMGLTASFLPHAATAQTSFPQPTPPGSTPPAYTIEDVRVQQPKPIFNFQARISQAKIPLGTAEFPSVTVSIFGESGNGCTEKFENVKVTDGVLNLRIGARPSCDLAEYMANNVDLKLKICLGANSCLKEIPLATVPYAVKATYAWAAQQAVVANRAAEAEVSHFLSADQDLQNPDELGRGYYDFHSPTDPKAVEAMMSEAGFVGESVLNDALDHGYIRWNPVYGSGEDKLHISAANGESLHELAELFLHSQSTQVTGAMSVHGGLSVLSDGADIHGDLLVQSPNATGSFSVDDHGAELTAQGTTIAATKNSIAFSFQNPTQAIVDFSGAKAEGLQLPDDFIVDSDNLRDVPASELRGIATGDRTTLQIPAAVITGTLAASQVPAPSADTITGGKLAANVVLGADQVTSGMLSSSRVPELSSLRGNLGANKVSGSWSQLNLSESETTTVRSRWLKFGHTTGADRGQGRALLDSNPDDALVVNYGADWPKVLVDSPLEVDGAIETTAPIITNSTSDVVPSRRDCSGGAFRIEGGSTKMCMDGNEIQTKTELYINHETGNRTFFGPLVAKHLRAKKMAWEWITVGSGTTVMTKDAAVCVLRSTHTSSCSITPLRNGVGVWGLVSQPHGTTCTFACAGDQVTYE